ncbi:MAG: putative 3-deoxy-D-manno-octulosonate cytidylyltransferase [Rhodospirillaceae bacterium]|nr:MAG: putative 3-deoxy-D-manno-octulosonate cytidylyltransferase [Rhodospirillaceae bacterium]TNC97410.1 MAG: putative 3-deoxy-D-manno-octulosonate cytidylyltransferase (Modular protein) [Stygiobacter sp.]
MSAKPICIIPARMASTRYPGKPLEPMLGLPLIGHVWHRCRMAPSLGRVVVATCDQVIKDAVEKLGGEAVMTADTHPGCVDRTVEAIANLGLSLADDALVLMVQGDEVMVTPAMIEDMVQVHARTRSPVVNLASVIQNEADHDDPNCVKVCAAPDGRALFFSRAAIPSRWRANGPVPAYQQTGIIGFSHHFLQTFGTLSRTPLEMIEQIDMLRTLEHGYPIQIVTVDVETVGVDTPADLLRGEHMLRSDPVTAQYMDLPA